ncbi:Stp1/IreP family PP2C-type Ser/Thr phosphatase [Bacillus marinisedimentorum]|uniref:Stp1/IreP family PP2C-type Ser/Thr phosphatase n=1 Tax=Bacillus marinisedimentorum TaxID=1821260 RepID=UPI0007E0E6B5|nr:Stp1/IreP family PP2C-type Ser/Thr phosphatase [Bacillus marinisedimentorum]
MESIFMTDRGKVRPHNEDSGGAFHSENGPLLAVVADGMGGHRAGDVASLMAVSLLKESWDSAAQVDNPGHAETLLESVFQKVNSAVFEYARDHSECEGMGTTMVGAVCTADFFTIASVGDSRGYIFNQNGFRQVTEDHSLVQELVKSGEITQEDAEHHPRKNVLTRAIGTEPAITADINTIGWDEGDALLLCSDGLSNKVTIEQMNKVLAEEGPLHSKAEKLIEMANDLGGEDNITLAIVRNTAPESR